MSWSEIQSDTGDGRNFIYWSGPPMPLADLILHVEKIAPGHGTVYVASPTTIKWDPSPADVESKEKAELKRLKAKYPNA